MAFAAHFTHDHNPQFVDPFSTGLVRLLTPTRPAATTTTPRICLTALAAVQMFAQNLITTPMEPVPHAQLLSSGLLLEDTEGMGLLDPVDGAAKTAKRGYEEGQEAKTLGEEVDDNYYQKPSTD